MELIWTYTLYYFDPKYHREGREEVEGKKGYLLEIESMEDLPWYISCCWSITDGSAGNKEGLTWYLESEVSYGHGSWISHLISFYKKRFFGVFPLEGFFLGLEPISHGLYFLVIFIFMF